MGGRNPESVDDTDKDLRILGELCVTMSDEAVTDDQTERNGGPACEMRSAS